MSFRIMGLLLAILGYSCMLVFVYFLFSKFAPWVEVVLFFLGLGGGIATLVGLYMICFGNCPIEDVF